MRITSPKYKSPKSTQNQAQQRKIQLLELSAKLLPQLLEKTFESRLTALEKASSAVIQDIFTIRSDIRVVTEKAAPFIGEYNQPQSIPQLSQYTSPDTSVITDKIKSIPLIANGSNSNEFKPSETRKAGRLSPLSPIIGSPHRDGLQDLTTHMFTYESPKSSVFQEFQTPPRQSRKNPFEFLLKAIESVTQISRRELAELRSLISPPPGVTSVMEALCILFDKKPKWPVARDLIGSGDIIARIVSYDINNLEQQTIEKIDLYVKSPLIEYEKLKIQYPVAAVLWKWIRSLHYCFISVAKAQREGIKFEQLTTNYMTYMTKEEEELEEKDEKPEKEYKLEPKPVKMNDKKQSDSSTMSEDQDKRLAEATKRVKAIQWRDLLNLLLVKNIPTEIKALFETVCLVQGKEPTWENAKLLIKKGCFLENIESVKPEFLPETAQEMIQEILDMTIPLQNEFPLIEDLRTWLSILDSFVVEKDAGKKQVSVLKEDQPREQEQQDQDVEKSIVRKISLTESSPTVSRKGSDSKNTVSRKGSDNIIKKQLKKQNTNSFNATLDINETIPNIPMISEVLMIFKGLKRSDFVELKRNRDIPAVRAVLEGLYLVFEVPPKVRIDMRTVGNLDFDRLVGDLDQLLTKIFQFDYDEIPQNLIIKLKEHTRQPKCSIANAKSVSSGVWALCIWLHSLIRFSETRDSMGYPAGYVQVHSPAHKKLEDILPLSLRGKSNSFSLSPSKSSLTSTQRFTPMRDYKILGDNEIDKEVDSNKFTLEFEDPHLSSQFFNVYFSITDLLEFKEKPHATKLTETIMKVFYTILTGRKLQVKEIQKALPSDGRGLNLLMNISPSNISVRAIKLAETEWKEIKNAEKILKTSSTVFAIFKWIQTILEAHSQQKDEGKVLLKKKSEGRDSNLETIIQEEPSFSVIPEEQAVPDSCSTSRRRQNNKSTLRMRSADLYNCDVEEIQNTSYLQRNLNELKREVTDNQADEGSSFMTNHLRSIIKEMKREENEANNLHWDGLLASKEHRIQLKAIINGDNEVDASNRELETYFSQKLDRYSTKINHLKTLNKLLTDSGIPINPPQKEYTMKAGTASFIRMIEPEWIRNLMNQPYWDVLISKILTVFVTIYGNQEAIDMPNDTELREQITEELKKIQGNTVSAMLEIGAHLELDTKIKIKMQKLLKQQKDILNPRSFDGIDGFCGVLSFLLKEVCEYLGLLPIDMVKKLNSKERLYLFNLQKIEYYESQTQKISEVASQHQLALERYSS